MSFGASSSPNVFEPRIVSFSDFPPPPEQPAMIKPSAIAPNHFVERFFFMLSRFFVGESAVNVRTLWQRTISSRMKIAIAGIALAKQFFLILRLCRFAQKEIERLPQ